MFYAVLGYAHAALWRVNLAVTRRVKAIHALADQRGQGTVEYVGLILLVSLLMVGMVGRDERVQRQTGHRAGGRHRRQDQGGGREGRLQMTAGAGTASVVLAHARPA